MRGRILWLFNHTSLRKFEVPLLIEMGYEVYCPKICEVEAGDFSTSVTYEYDSSLSIPKSVIEKLNRVDFYSEIDSETMKLVNQYFDIVICLAMCTPIKCMARWFKGVLGIHAFGLAGESTYTYLFYTEEGLGLLDSLKRMGDRFWFMPSYDNIAKIESPLLRNHTIYMPIGLRDTTINHKWKGGDERFLFISPKIRSNEYYTWVYNRFCEHFGDLPHVIGGGQAIPVTNDSTVTGFLSDEEYEYNMTHLSAMYYHSREKRHVHYHPFEAVRNGMPLIFMAGGMLDHLGGKNLPGRCRTIDEARAKLKKLARGNRAFINKIVQSQSVLLEKLDMSYCREWWETGMARMDAAVRDAKQAAKKQEKKKVAVVLPLAYLGGVLDYSIRFALNIWKEARDRNDNVEIVFARPESKLYEETNYFTELEKRNIPIRVFTATVESGKWVDNALTLAGYQPKEASLLPDMNYGVLRDGIADFMDCDYTFFMADYVGVVEALFWLRPYAVVVHDYIQRHVPGIISPYANYAKLYMQRRADKIFVTSEPTMVEAIQYGQIRKDKVVLTPLMLEKVKKPEYDKIIHKKPYFLWSTNISKHKNHIAALNALEAYYEKGGKLDCVMTGTNSEQFHLKYKEPVGEYVDTVRKMIKRSDALKSHIFVKGNLSKQHYLNALEKAAFVFSPTYGDNGTGTAFDGAALGVPTLCSDYPAMRYLSEFTRVPCTYMDPYSEEDMTKKLLYMERECRNLAMKLPSEKELMKRNYDNFSGELYEHVHRILFG